MIHIYENYTHAGINFMKSKSNEVNSPNIQYCSWLLYNCWGCNIRQNSSILVDLKNISASTV